ncbi:MAG: hypothetical protein GTN78_02685 [Gemmatimonadales bacterium]|nr:hypothetical protein [Gemmatimonadales bacterium]NIS63889.1 hypothetical protein [Gemmatimonadales bacterium]
MSSRLGIEIGPRRLRAVRFRGLASRRFKVMELEWDGEALTDAVAELKEQFGAAGAVAVAVDLESLLVKRVKLPPLPLRERRRILALEPERFFPVRAEELVVSVREEDDLVFATRLEQLNRWVSALEQLGPVELAEAVPISLARACCRAGLPTAAIITPPLDGRCTALIEIVDGRVTGVRKVYGSAADAAAALAETGARSPAVYVTPWSDEAAGNVTGALPGATVKPLPAPRGLAAPYAAAYGAALGIGKKAGETLASPDLVHRIAVRQRRRLAVAAVGFAAALGFALLSLDNFRARAMNHLDSDLAVLRQRATAVLDLQAEAEALNRESRALADIAAQRADPLRVLLAVSRLLPPDAHIRALRGTVGEWQLDGYAKDAARLIPIFEASAAFEDAHFLRATNRAQIGADTYEEFSLALRYLPTP